MNTQTQTETRKRITVRVGGELREGTCTTCGHRTAKQFYIDQGRVDRMTIKEVVENKDHQAGLRVRVRCPLCGGEGRLIVRVIAIDAPLPPACPKLSCYWEFSKATCLVGLISKYHNLRVLYAQKKRGEKIPDKYRTGRPGPLTFKTGIMEVLRLKYLLRITGG